MQRRGIAGAAVARHWTGLAPQFSGLNDTARGRAVCDSFYSESASWPRNLWVVADRST